MLLIWTCDKCGKPIPAGKGSVWCDSRQAMECYRLARAHEARHPDGLIRGPELVEEGRELAAAGYRVAWHAEHLACDEAPERSCYWIDVGRAADVAALLEWNRHLHEKVWTRYTDWDRFALAATRTS